MILGHQKQRQFLEKLVETRKVSHAYLFSGQSQLGKKTVALEFVKLLFCQDKRGMESCKICRPCQDLQKGIHPDFFLVEPQESGERREIKISQIRDLNWKLSLHPASAPFKVALIDKASSLNSEAQNCLLKTLEEPKGRAVLILVASNPKLLFPTILSRVQNIRFFPVLKSDIEEYLKTKGCSSKKSQEITMISFGKPGLAINFLLESQELKRQNKRIEEIIQLTKSDLPYRFQYVKSLTSQKHNLKEILDIWLRYFRSILLEKVREPSASTQPSLNKLQKTIQIIEKIKFLIEKTNINQRLALEQIMLEL